MGTLTFFTILEFLKDGFYSLWKNTFIIFPANICLGEDVFKTSFIFVCKRWCQDILIKTDIFNLVIHFRDVFKRFWRHVEDVLQSRLQDLFKTSSRHLQDILKKPSSCLQDVFKTYHSRKISLIDIVKAKIYRTISLGHTSRGIYHHGTNFLRVNSFDIRKLSELFFRALYVMTAFTY